MDDPPTPQHAPPESPDAMHEAVTPLPVSGEREIAIGTPDAFCTPAVAASTAQAATDRCDPSDTSELRADSMHHISGGKVAIARTHSHGAPPPLGYASLQSSRQILRRSAGGATQEGDEESGGSDGDANGGSEGATPPQLGTTASQSWLGSIGGRIANVVFSKETQETISQVSALLSLFFDDVEESKIDMMTSLLLLSSYYDAPNVTSGLAETDRDTLRNAFYYWRFAACAYGWKLLNGFFFQDKERNLLLGLVQGDNKNMTVLCEHCELEQSDIVDVCWNSTDFEPGHYIAIDRCSESIIVAFRGTFHIKDALSDLVATSVPFMGGAAHGGIMQCATRKMANIRPILEELVLQYPGYQVVFTGHSLGAGTASLSAMMFKDENPDVIVSCHAYAVPCVLSLDLAFQCRSYITSYIHEFDVVPRLSLGSLERLKQLSRKMMENTEGSSNTARLFHSYANATLTQLHPDTKRRIADWFACNEPERLQYEADSLEDKLYPPGRLYHLLKEGDKGLYRMEVTNATFFADIKVCVRMFTDHMPNEYELSFRGVRKRQSSLRKTRGKMHKSDGQAHSESIGAAEHDGDDALANSTTSAAAVEPATEALESQLDEITADEGSVRALSAVDPGAGSVHVENEEGVGEERKEQFGEENEGGRVKSGQGLSDVDVEAAVAEFGGL